MFFYCCWDVATNKFLLWGIKKVASYELNLEQGAGVQAEAVGPGLPGEGQGRGVVDGQRRVEGDVPEGRRLGLGLGFVLDGTHMQRVGSGMKDMRKMVLIGRVSK